MTKTAKLLCDLIALPSVNPAFATVARTRAGEKKVADFLAGLAAQAKLEVEFQKVLPGRSNLIVRLAPAGKIERRILLAPHLDTVDTADEKAFSPRAFAGKIFGRGACDTKGSVAVMFSALCELAGLKSRPQNTEIIFAGLVDEENAQAGSRGLVAGGLRADLAIVGEPTKLKIITAHKGSVWLKLETRGKSAHGARPELGSNAVHAMARIVDCLETEYAKILRRRRHALLGHPTINVGTICGGTQPNIVPDKCVIAIDRRTLPGESEHGVRREISALLGAKKLRASFDNAKLAPCLPMETDARLPLVRQFMKRLGQRRPAGVDFFCDAAVLAGAGIPSVVFGPGDIAQAHTVDEWIFLSQLDHGREMLLRFLRSLP